MHIGTQEIMGSTQWEVSAGKGMITRAGHAQFTVQYLQAIFVVSQTLDTRNRPQIKELEFELGNIQVRNSIHSIESFLIAIFVLTVTGKK